MRVGRIKHCMVYFLRIQLLLIYLSILAGNAQIKVPAYFSDDMVLQQKTNVPFFGTASPNTPIEIKVSWAPQSIKTISDPDGNWETPVPTPSYGGPYQISILGNGEILIKNVLIGEVWLCSGQSNMEMPLGGWGKINNYEEEILNADYPKIRLLQVEHKQHRAPSDADNISATWQLCNPESIAGFSATAYFFARKIWEETKIPIGLIHSSWGGTVIEAWMSKQSLKNIDAFNMELQALTSKKAQDALNVMNTSKMENWDKTVEVLDGKKSHCWTKASYNDSGWETMALPGYWEDMDKTLRDFNGTIWFRKSIKLTDVEARSDIEIVFTADDNDKLWVNGKFIGASEGYDKISKYRIPKQCLNVGANSIVIRVFDGANQGGIYGNEFFIRTSERHIPLAGIWKCQLGVSLQDLPKKPTIYQQQNRPSVLFNAMIHPFVKFPITGVLWYQGESNVDRAHQYRTLFPLMIQDWRSHYSNNSLSFYFVQLANFNEPIEKPVNSSWAELRDAQLQTYKALSNTGMIVTTDIGNPFDIHPKNKQEVGRRLALIALDKKYGKKNVFTGPIYQDFKVVKNIVEISFESTGTEHGLVAAHHEPLKGFSIAGENKVFYQGKAIIKGNKVFVSSSKVLKPKAVRYNWSDNPQGNLYNRDGLPASPFKTDQWEDITK
ncbi:sialate O-acetylesterase [Galbibacter pacificus]|nr:sialate O-acetylesterase [Galbibacter pacificus]